MELRDVDVIVQSKKCIRCGEEKELELFNKDARCIDGLRNVCKSCKAIDDRSCYMNAKNRVYEAYGGYVCNCCGETEPSFLSIDHINNDGAEYRRNQNGQGTGKNLYYWIINNNFPKDLRVLCHNCNLGRHINNGECPHEVLRRQAGD